MNQFDIGTRRMAGDQYLAMIRLPKHGQFVPVCRSGKPVLYGTEAAALRAAGKTICDYVNGKLRRDGEVLLGPREQANALFKGGVPCLPNR